MKTKVVADEDPVRGMTILKVGRWLWFNGGVDGR